MAPEVFLSACTGHASAVSRIDLSCLGEDVASAQRIRSIRR
jgi:hypothetical protein